MLTGHKTFDRQCHGGLTTGNVIGGTQLSWYIRPKHATECNGLSFAPGILLESDLKAFRDLPKRVARFIEELGRQVILNEIRHWTGPRWRPKKHIHGYIVTEGHDCGYAHIRTFPAGTGTLSLHILHSVTPSLTGGKALP